MSKIPRFTSAEQVIHSLVIQERWQKKKKKKLTEFCLGILHGGVRSVLVPEQQKSKSISTSSKPKLINRNTLRTQTIIISLPSREEQVK